MSPMPGWMDRLRQPEYTGENRCTPCTIVNVVIAVALSVVVGAVALPLGLVAFVTSLGVIYLRGYLVPYTPTLTKQYFPDRVLRWFDKHPSAQQADSTTDEVQDLDISQTLYELGVITECDHVDDLCLDSEFQQAWRDSIVELRDRDRDSRRAAIVDLLDLDDDHEIEERGHAATMVSVDGQHVGQWESNAALVADLAADETLRAWTDEWQRFHVINRSQILNTLRMFLEQCPACDSPVSVDQETVESCCRSFDVAAVTCDGCGSRLFEIELTDEMQSQL